MGEIEDRLARLAAHRAAQVPAFSIERVDELAVRRRATRRRPALVAIAACLAVALVIGGLLLVARGDKTPSVQVPAGPPTTAPAVGAVAGCVGKAYVDNQADDTVSVITMATGAVSAPIAVGDNPAAVSMAPDGKHVYVTNDGGSVSNSGVLVANPRDDTVSVITTATDAVSGTITVGKGPGPVAITPDNQFGYEANNGDGTVSVISTARGVVTRTIPVGTAPGMVAITPDGNHAYVTNEGDDTVSVITTATGVVSGTIPVGKTPARVAITPDGRHAYVTNYGDGTISVISTATGGVLRTIAVGKAPTAVAITPDGQHAYVTNRLDGTVSVITTATGLVSGTITLGVVPNGLAITPDGTHVYVADLLGTPGSNTVSVIDTATDAVSGVVTVGNQPGDVAICPAPRTDSKRPQR